MIQFKKMKNNHLSNSEYMGIGIVVILLFSSICYVHAQDSSELIIFFNEQFIPVEDVNVENGVVVVEYKIGPLFGPEKIGKDTSYIFGKIAKEFPNSDTIRIEGLVGEEILFVYSVKTSDILDYVNGKMGDKEIKSKIIIEEESEGSNLEMVIYVLIIIVIIIVLLLLVLSAAYLVYRSKKKKSTQNEAPQATSKGFNFGMVSFIIGGLMGFLLFVLFVLTGIIDASTPGGIPDDGPILEVIGLFVILGVFACVVGVGLGIAGLFQKNQKKRWSVLGLIINALIIMWIAVLFISIP